MSYFQQDLQCKPVHSEWSDLVEFIRHEWKPKHRNILNHLEFPIDVKALSVFSIARRLIMSAEELGENQWPKKFIGTMMILFPMIELVGHARVGPASGYDQTETNLGAGIEFLLDPETTPRPLSQKSLKTDYRRLDKLVQYMDHHKEGPRVSDLFFIRNYFLHGVKSHKDKNSSMEDMMNFELPKAIVPRAEYCLKIYWKQLKQDDGKKGWVKR